MSFKIIVLGLKGVGRSTLLKKWTDQMILDNKKSKGVEFFCKEFFNNKINELISLKLWSLDFISNYNYIQKSSGVLLIFDILRYNTLEPLVNYIHIITETKRNIPIVLVGNKLDLDYLREISTEEGEEFAEKYFLSSYIEISAKYGTNIEKLFESLTNLIIRRPEPEISFI